MTKPYLAVEILNASDSWVDCTTDIMDVRGEGIGLFPGRERPGIFSNVGRLTVTLENSARTYNPGVDAATGLAECDRRIRLKYVAATAGKILQTQHSGIGNNSDFYQAQNAAITTADVFLLTWEARAQFDSQYNTDNVLITTSGNSGPSTQYTYTNKWATYTYTWVATADATWFAVNFIPIPTGITTNAKVVEYRNISLTINGGANLLVNGDFATGSVSPWAAYDTGAATGYGAAYYNVDQDVLLEASSGPGGNVSATAFNSTAAIGNVGGVAYERAQSFQPQIGMLDRFTFTLGANTGTPVGTLTWIINSDNTGAPDKVLATGTMTPTASAENHVILPRKIFVYGTTYHVHLKATTAQASGVHWNWKIHTAGTYAGGNESYYDGTWHAEAAVDTVFSVTTLSATEKTKLAMTFVNTLGVALTVTKVRLWLKKVGAPADTMTLRVESLTDGKPSGTLIHANASTVEAEATATTSYGWIDFVFATPWPLAIGGTGGIVLSTGRAASSTDYINWGADGSDPTYTDGEMLAYDGAAWLPEQKDAVFEVIGTAASSTALSVIDDYLIRFNGTIENVQPSPFAKGGDHRCVLSCVDLTQTARKTMIDVELQENKRGDELLTIALAAMQTGTLNTTLPGKQLDTGRSTFPISFDSYDVQTSVLDAVRDICISEGAFLSFQWFDLDGTFRWAARDFIARLTTLTSARLTLAGKDTGVAGGDQFSMTVLKNASMRINQVLLTCHPRQIIAGPVVLGKINSPITIPPINADGTPGTVQVTLTYRDPDTGRYVGGKNVMTPVPTTDYLINAVSEGSDWGDYTNSPSFALTVDTNGGAQMTVTLKNYAIGNLYATRLQCRGDMLVTYDPLPITKTHADVTNGTVLPAPYALDMPFLSEQALGESIANYIINRYHEPFMEAVQIKIDAKTALQGVDLLTLEIGDLLLISDPQAGMPTAKKHMITAIDYDLKTDMGGIAGGSITLTTMRIEDNTYWVLGDATYGKLGTTTRLWI